MWSLTIASDFSLWLISVPLPGSSVCIYMCIYNFFFCVTHCTFSSNETLRRSTRPDYIIKLNMNVKPRNRCFFYYFTLCMYTREQTLSHLSIFSQNVSHSASFVSNSNRNGKVLLAAIFLYRCLIPWRKKKPSSPPNHR